MANLKESYEIFEQEKSKAFGQLYTHWAKHYPEVDSIYWQYKELWGSPITMIRDGKWCEEWENQIRYDFEFFASNVGADIMHTCPTENIIELDNYR